MSSISPPRTSRIGLKAALSLAIFAAGWMTGRCPSPKTLDTFAAVAKLAVMSPAVKSASTHTSALTNHGELPVQWSQLEAADYPGFIARLRAAGCPELTIRDLVLTDLGRNYSEKIKRLGSQTGTETTESVLGVARLLAERDGLAWQLLRLDYEAELRTIWPQEFGDAADVSFVHLDPVQRWQARQIEREFLEAERVLQNQAAELGERFEEVVADLRARRAERLRFALPQSAGIH